MASTGKKKPLSSFPAEAESPREAVLILILVYGVVSVNVRSYHTHRCPISTPRVKRRNVGRNQEKKMRQNWLYSSMNWCKSDLRTHHMTTMIRTYWAGD